MANLDKQREEVEKMLDEIEEKIKKEWGEESFASKYGLERDILEGEDEVMGVLFVLPSKKEEVWEKIDEWFSKRKISIAVFSLGVREFIKKFVQKWKAENGENLKIGEEIEGLEEDGIAIYINWTNTGIVLHQYKEGKFLSKSCKKIPLWETSNGIWIVGFKDKETAKKFVEELKEKIKKEFGKDYSVNFHPLCWGEDQDF